MMKISRFSSPSSKARSFFAVVGITLAAPIGSPVGDLVKKENPWHGFVARDPVLTSMRVQKVNGACEPWIRALIEDVAGKAIPASTREAWDGAVPAWAPWRKDDLEAIIECEDMPCAVKLNQQETTQMASVEKEVRRQKFLDVVWDRIKKYLKTQERDEYEFPGKPVDPWKVFQTLGLKTGLTPSSKIELSVRVVDLSPGRIRAVRQVMDQRLAVARDRHEAALWRRDVYTDHYFDSWGEWMDVSCDPQLKPLS